MRQELLFTHTPTRGCVTCKKRNLRCDDRKPACKRCVNSGRNCEGYYISTVRKPSDVTVESVVEFRQRFLPSREHPKKALVVLPVEHLQTPNVFHSFATIALNGLAAQDDVMQHIIRAMLSRSNTKYKESRREQTKIREMKMGLVRFHEPVKEIFDLSRPEDCPVIRSAFMVQMYRTLMDIMMSKGHTSDQAIHNILVASSQGRRK